MISGGWHAAQLGLRRRGDLRVRRIEAGARLQEDLDDRLAADRRRFDMLDIIDRRGQAALIAGRDPAFHLFGIQAGIGPGNRDHRNIDVREDVGRRAQDHDRADD